MWVMLNEYNWCVDNCAICKSFLNLYRAFTEEFSFSFFSKFSCSCRSYFLLRRSVKLSYGDQHWSLKYVKNHLLVHNYSNLDLNSYRLGIQNWWLSVLTSSSSFICSLIFLIFINIVNLRFRISTQMYG